MEEKLKLLFPKPQRLNFNEGYLTITNNIQIFLPTSLHHSIPFTAKITEKLNECGLTTEIIASQLGIKEKAVIISLKIHRALFHQSESYKIVIDNSGVSILGSDSTGLFYGVITFIQIIELSKQETGKNKIIIPYLIIVDWPDFPNRGVMIDVSRDKVPKMETLYDLIDLLSSWKINQIQLYIEHTFAYQGHERVWKDASPFTGEEIIALNRFCQDRFIELVPNQNSFGHFHRWLIHDPYREFAECPDGYENPFSFGTEKEPFSLCPIDPRSLELLDNLYDQLLPNFSSQQFNVGLDETFDLGVGRSSERCLKEGKGTVYLEFLQKIYSLVAQKRDKIMQFWADVVFEHPELIPKLPKDVIALIWGYEEEHPFNEQCQIMKKTSLSYYVCPGTSSWNSFAGRTENAIGNLRNAAINGKEYGAIGYLITDWGDHGHLQPFPISFLGFLVGAGLAWNCTSRTDNIQSLLSIHGFRDTKRVMGKIAYDLGNVYNKFDLTIPNNSVLFLIMLLSAYSTPKLIMEKVNLQNLDIAKEYLNQLFGGVSIKELENTRQYIDEVSKQLISANIQRKDADLIIREFQWVIDILKFACDFGIARLKIGIDIPVAKIPEKTRSVLIITLKGLIEQHQEIWLHRNRKGGLNDSMNRLKRILSFLEA